MLDETGSASESTDLEDQLVSSDDGKPFYLRDGAIKDELETNISVLNPHQREKYGSVEDTVSNQFVNIYGKYLNEEQKDYFSKRQIVVTSFELADKFAEEWNPNGVSIDPEIAQIEGEVYTGYSIGRPVEENAPTKTHSGSIVNHYWAGRFAVYPLGEDEIADVDPRWLISQEQFETQKDINGEFRNRFADIFPFVYTNGLAAVSVHEKVHGIQDCELPLPLLEAAAHYYQLEVAKANGWEAKIGSNMEQLAKLYEKLIVEIGEEVHLLVFGNIKDQLKKDSLLKEVKDRFSKDNIEKASKYEEMVYLKSPERYVYWKTQPAKQ